MKTIVSSVLLLLLFVLPALGASRLIYVNAEDCIVDGDEWDSHASYGLYRACPSPECGSTFDCDDSDPYAGSWAFESQDPNDTCCSVSNTSDSAFRFDISDNFGSNLTWGSEMFIRYQLKLPTNFCDSASDVGTCPDTADGGVNQFRMTQNPGTDEIELSYWITNDAQGNLHWYGNTVKYPQANVLTKDNQWHEIALYIKMPTSGVAADGIVRAWKDGNGTYTAGNAAWSYDNLTEDNVDYYKVAVATLIYYKGPNAGNWTFWIDEFEVWDGIPPSPSITIKGLELSILRK